jgi:hypothetical protein
MARLAAWFRIFGAKVPLARPRINSRQASRSSRESFARRTTLPPSTLSGRASTGSRLPWPGLNQDKPTSKGWGGPEQIQLYACAFGKPVLCIDGAGATLYGADGTRRTMKDATAVREALESDSSTRVLVNRDKHFESTTRARDAAFFDSELRGTRFQAVAEATNENRQELRDRQAAHP